MSLRLALALCLTALPAAAQDVVILGEVHDNPAHHAEQAAQVAAIQPRALVFRRSVQVSEVRLFGPPPT